MPPDDVDVDELPVAPMTAPGNKRCVASGDGDGRKKDHKRCSGLCFGCTKKAEDCSGMNKEKGWRHCKLLKKLIAEKHPVMPENKAEIEAICAASVKKNNGCIEKLAMFAVVCLEHHSQL